MSKASECVKVMVRVRPMNKKENDLGCEQVVEVENSTNTIILHKPKSGEVPKRFSYDSVYQTNCKQEDIYNESAFPLVESVLEGYNGTIFAYGQTGCGKTHTMVGVEESDELKGIIPRAYVHIFSCIDEAKEGVKFLVRCSYLEIYNEDHKLDVKEDPKKGVFVQGLTNIIVKSTSEINKCMIAGNKNRKTGETAMNKDSSRSHSIFTIYIEHMEEVTDGTSEAKIRAGKLHLVDLAGSERQSKTHATGDRLKEAQKINLSLSALGNVISALVDGKSTHIPYRDSKLTRLLQDSLGGNTKTVMIAAVSPADYNYDETLSTLRYASRAKSIKNKPVINEDPKDALLRQYEEEIKHLKDMLKSLSEGGNKTLIKQGSIHLPDDIMFEDSIESLVKKIQQKGKKIKIIEEENEEDGSETRRTINERINEIEEFDEVVPKRGDSNKFNASQKEMLEKLVQEMENKLVQKDMALDEKEKLKLKKIRKMQLALKKQKEKERILSEEKQKEEEEKLFYEKQYNNKQEELKEKDSLLRELRERYKGALQEIKDLEEEHEDEHAELLNTVRDQECEIKLLKGMLSMLLTNNEILSIRRKCEFNEEDKEWEIPYFFLKGKQVQLPTLSRNKARDLVENEKENREVVFDNNNNNNSNNNSRVQEPQRKINKQLATSSSHPLLIGNIPNEDFRINDESLNFAGGVQNLNIK